MRKQEISARLNKIRDMIYQEVRDEINYLGIRFEEKFIDEKYQISIVDEEPQVGNNTWFDAVKNVKHNIIKSIEKKFLGQQNVNRYELKNFYNNFIIDVTDMWMNRLVVIHYFEINNWLKNTNERENIRLLSSTYNLKLPDILSNYMFLKGYDNRVINNYIELNDERNLFKYFIFQQMRKFSIAMPELFYDEETFYELLFPINCFFSHKNIISFFNEIPDEDFINYINEKMFIKDNSAKYLINNTLGRIASEYKSIIPFTDLEMFTSSRKLRDDAAHKYYTSKTIEDIKLFDPYIKDGCSLVYAFDLYYEMYHKLGYLKESIPECILNNNLYGIVDNISKGKIDFMLIIKALSKNPKIEIEKLKNNLCSFYRINKFDVSDVYDMCNNFNISDGTKEIIRFTIAEYSKLVGYHDLLIHKYKYQLHEYKKAYDEINMKLDKKANWLKKLFHQIIVLISQYDVVVSQYAKRMPSQSEIFIHSFPFVGRCSFVGIIFDNDYINLCKKSKAFVLQNYRIYNIVNLKNEAIIILNQSQCPDYEFVFIDLFPMPKLEKDFFEKKEKIVIKSNTFLTNDKSKFDFHTSEMPTSLPIGSNNIENYVIYGDIIKWHEKKAMMPCENFSKNITNGDSLIVYKTNNQSLQYCNKDELFYGYKFKNIKPSYTLACLSSKVFDYFYNNYVPDFNKMKYKSYTEIEYKKYAKFKIIKKREVNISNIEEKNLGLIEICLNGIETSIYFRSNPLI